MAAFRGRSCFKPFIKDGKLFFKNLQNWNVLSYNGKLYWNPSAESTGWFDEGLPSGVVEIPKDEVCALFNERPIDIPGLLVYLRMLVGENNWSRFVEKQGIPQVVLTVPEGTPDEALNLWNYRAKSIFEGGSGALPSGSSVDVLDSARGQDPFTEYLKHQREAICILAVGGSLNVLGGATGLGSNLADVQQQAFNSLVNADCKRISNAISQVVVPKVTKILFGQEALCRFTYVEDDEYSAQDYLDMATKLHALGVKLDPMKLKEITKLDFISDDQVEEWTPPET